MPEAAGARTRVKRYECGPTMFCVVFTRDDDLHEWWDLYFLDIEEARRWAEQELRLRRRRVGRWIAEIDEVRWDEVVARFRPTSCPSTRVETSS